ncbi:MAG: ABC transporter permease [Cyclobacteriaceae bacterium]
MGPTPPKFFDRLLVSYCRQADLEDLQGDIYEVFEDRANTAPFRAKLLFALDTLNLFNPFSKHRKRNTWLGEAYHFNFRNQFTRSARYVRKHPFINALKIVGLSLALCAFLYISDYVSFHEDFDGFHENKNRIYRVVTTVTSPDLQDVTAWSHGYIRDIADEFPSVAQIVRLLKVEETVLIDTGAKQFEEGEVFYTDPEFSEVFSYQWLEGNASTALEEPNSVVLTKSIAQKYFGVDRGIIGKTLLIDDESFQVTGLVDDIPANSDLKFDFLLPFNYSDMEEWMFVYLLLQPNTSIIDLEQSFPEALSYYNDDYTDEGVSLQYDFENIQDVHFSEARLYDTPKMDRDRIFLFKLIGWVILLIAMANYINLYTTQLLQRIRNINIQMVVGATKKQLFVEFAGEAFLYLGLALGLSLGLTYLTVDLMSQYTDFKFFEVSDPLVLVLYSSFGFGVAIIALASYALTLSANQSSLFNAETNQIKAPLRKALIGVQFALSFAMILGTLVIYQQTSYLQNQPLGFSTNKVISFQFPDQARQSTIEVLKEDLRQLDIVEVVSQLEGNSVPGMDPWVENYNIDNSANTKLVEELGVDQHYLEVLQIDMVAGEFFDKNKHRAQRAFAVNQAFVNHFGWEANEAIGKRLDVYGFKGRIVGVTDNFFFNSPHQLIQPMVIRYYPTATNAMVRLTAQSDLISAINKIEAVWSEYLPGVPFNFSYLSADYENQYRHEEATLNVLAAIAALVIALSLLGMHAILIMLAKAREKELGIRKVVGATSRDLFDLFVKDFLYILLIGIALAIPILWLGLNSWLAEYPIRIALNPLTFLVVAFFIFGIAGLVIFVQALKSYRTNTIEALKYE